MRAPTPSRRTTRIASHQKIVSRQLAKKFLRDAKGECLQLLTDTSFFHDVRTEHTLKCNVLPWLLDEAEKFVTQLDQLNRYSAHATSSFLGD